MPSDELNGESGQGLLEGEADTGAVAYVLA